MNGYLSRVLERAEDVPESRILLVAANDAAAAHWLQGRAPATHSSHLVTLPNGSTIEITNAVRINSEYAGLPHYDVVFIENDGGLSLAAYRALQASAGAIEPDLLLVSRFSLDDWANEGAKAYQKLRQADWPSEYGEADLRREFEPKGWVIESNVYSLPKQAIQRFPPAWLATLTGPFAWYRDNPLRLATGEMPVGHAEVVWSRGNMHYRQFAANLRASAREAQNEAVVRYDDEPGSTVHWELDADPGATEGSTEPVGSVPLTAQQMHVILDVLAHEPRANFDNPLWRSVREAVESALTALEGEGEQTTEAAAPECSEKPSDDATTVVRLTFGQVRIIIGMLRYLIERQAPVPAPQHEAVVDALRVVFDESRDVLDVLLTEEQGAFICRALQKVAPSDPDATWDMNAWWAAMSKLKQALPASARAGG